MNRFVWYELMTSDPDAARRFYTSLLGWKAQAWEADPSYTIWLNGDAPIGGLMGLPDEAAREGASPFWVGYVAVDDADAAADRARSMGAALVRPPLDLPTVGRIIFLRDPQGAIFSVFQPEGEGMPAAAPAPGLVSWHELATTDPDAAFRFYSDLFGWEQMGEFDMGPEGVYRLFGGGEETLGGIFRKPASIPGKPAWLYYVMVADADRAATQAVKLGAHLVQEPVEVPGGDRIAVFLDPQGAATAVHARPGN